MRKKERSAGASRNRVLYLGHTDIRLAVLGAADRRTNNDTLYKRAFYTHDKPTYQYWNSQQVAFVSFKVSGVSALQ